ncbi:arginase family protein [Streptomyces sp. NPDC058463]|uniref:arginase family protein n=1 Tax=Streptomyces sp. NPDC058463 TaxID=3346510 RepID=UPI003669E140
MRLADAVGAALDAGHFPVVLGGDCSILLGNLLALRRRGRYGLLFLDGRFLPALHGAGRRGGLDGTRPGHRPRPFVAHRSRRPQAPPAGRGRCRFRVP